MHTKKNTIISNYTQLIWYLWPTVVWKTHDYKMFKDEFSPKNKSFKETTLLADLWYLWIVSDYWDKIKEIIMPEKKSRKSKKNPEPSLSEIQKEDNKKISRFRIKVENAIWWVKRLGIVTQVFRNKCKKFNDAIMEVACAIWNLHILF